jgi:hypothetical protein
LSFDLILGLLDTLFQGRRVRTRRAGLRVAVDCRNETNKASPARISSALESCCGAWAETKERPREINSKIPNVQSTPFVIQLCLVV